ncbi:hypothetical protein CfE428DRAFT_3664 [Chthoniobacter flavus Ellin428]|uniref:Squalene cyclase C-terminal domain-containing protein n=1 Tax=Chthoniobacter flavus Ellin428 TaxID=497964 RepID=B4D426_9BACT|nr:prenyltransferase/squalene oxidase repeat-containing protein [Chthoniobacter flavus]EDY19006.1 hypothetical protein CfE428DRAFT_3664 [Chthoniobacter flavus Ellin428]TCO93587.1 prenyltransferase/squalene oxidase-like repeat protein [Chthoniobacter flavus]
MKAHPPTVRLFTFLLALSAAIAYGDEAPKPDDAQLRAGVVRSLAFLDKEADTWMDEKSCNGCHHMPELLWSHREAKRRGFAIDPKMFAEFVDWSYSHSKDTRAGLEMVALLKLAMPDKPAPELTDLIVKGQQPDGSWKPAGQLANMQRRGPHDAMGNSTRLFLLALGTQPADQATTDAARAKATAALAKDEPAKSVETLVYRGLYAQRFGPSDDVATARAELLKLQHPDGGWSYIVGQEASDSLATGEALYLLQQAPDTTSAEAIAHGQAWLLNHQRADGGWDIDITKISKTDRSAPEKAKSLKDATGIYTFWGSAWATIGLVQAFPITEAAGSTTP